MIKMIETRVSDLLFRVFVYIRIESISLWAADPAELYLQHGYSLIRFLETRRREKDCAKARELLTYFRHSYL